MVKRTIMPVGFLALLFFSIVVKVLIEKSKYDSLK